MAKLLIYGLNYAPEPTGIGKYTGEMAAWLHARGHQVDVIAGLPHYPDWKIDDDYVEKRFHEEIMAGVRVFRTPLYVPPANQLTAKNRILLELSYSLNTLRYWLPIMISPNRYDVVIAVSPPLQIGIYPWMYRVLRRVPWVFHIQDLQVDAAIRLGMFKGGKFERLLYKIENFLLKRATRVSTITEAMRKRIEAKGVSERQTWLFPNWSDIQFVKPMPRENNFRRELGVSEDQMLLMYAGNMGEKQGLEFAIFAAEKLKSNQKICFFMIGAGAAKDRLERLTQDMNLLNVRFLPVQPVERLPEMLAAADIHLVVQKREAADLVMPSKLTNILAAGRPSVGTADPGTTLYEVLCQHKSGIVTPPDNLDAFVTAINELVENSVLREEMGTNARLYAERYLDKEIILQDFEQKLLEL